MDDYIELLYAQRSVAKIVEGTVERHIQRGIDIEPHGVTLLMDTLLKGLIALQETLIEEAESRE